jgi:hypothetical protein
MEITIRSDVFGLSSTEHLRRNAVLHPNDDMVMMWWLCHFISWWFVGLNTSDLTQWSCLIICIASDLCQVHQKNSCTVWSIISLQHLPPQMKNHHGLNEEKTLLEKYNLSIESNEVNVWLVCILTTKSKSFKRVETCQRHFTFWLFCHVKLFLQNLDVCILLICSALNPWLFILIWMTSFWSRVWKDT